MRVVKNDTQRIDVFFLPMNYDPRIDGIKYAVEGLREHYEKEED